MGSLKCRSNSIRHPVQGGRRTKRPQHIHCTNVFFFCGAAEGETEAQCRGRTEGSQRPPFSFPPSLTLFPSPGLLHFVLHGQFISFYFFALAESVDSRPV